MMDGHPNRFSTDFEQILLGGHLTRRGVGCPRVPLGTGPLLVRSVFQPLGHSGRRGRVQSPNDFSLKGAKFGTTDNLFMPSNSIPHYLRTTEPTSSRQTTVSATTANPAEAPPRSQALVSTEDRSWVGGSSDGHC
jgi:hypothetical protein